jgi:uncharacterized membrane-anchored protein YhcB (DUF1043 family)
MTVLIGFVIGLILGALAAAFFSGRPDVAAVEKKIQEKK